MQTSDANFVPQTLYRGFAPEPHWGTSVPRLPSSPPPRSS